MSSVELPRESTDLAVERGAPTCAAPAAGSLRGGTSTGLVALLTLQAWVWTASALPKVTSPAFLSGFARFIGTAPQGRPALYGRLVTHVVLAAPSLFGWGAILVESGLALTFTVATVVLLGRRGRPPRRLVISSAVASLVGAAFALNLALLVGDAAPWTLGDPFDSGVAVEYLLVGLALATAVSAIGVVRRPSRPRRARAGRPWLASRSSREPNVVVVASVHRPGDARSIQ